MRHIVRALLLILAGSSSVLSYSVGSINVDTFTDSRIIGGKPAVIGQLPFQVGLQIKVENRTQLGTCGGALIADNFVLTAAHCVAFDGIEHVEVHLGALELKNPNEGHTVVIVPKDHLIPHGWWDPDTISNDIALLKLPEKVTLSDKIKPVDLPSYSDVYHLDVVNKMVTASGWGRFSDDSNDAAQFLQYASVKVLDQYVCRHFYPDLLRSSMVCTNTGLGQGTCHGDSGGPLTYTDDKTKRTILIGLTSFGKNLCVGAGFPSVFTRITSFLTWIAENSDVKVNNF